MKRIIVLLVTLGALAAPLVANAGNVAVRGWALEANGARCSTDCQAAADVQYNSGVHATAGPAAVSSGSSTCFGQAFNYGSTEVAPGCSPDYNPGFNMYYGSVAGGNIYIETWIRHGCGGGGFYYSPTHSINIYITSFGQSSDWYAGTLRLASPTQCFPALLTNAGLKAALVG